jgi:hypothetical protein
LKRNIVAGGVVLRAKAVLSKLKLTMLMKGRNQIISRAVESP